MPRRYSGPEKFRVKYLGGHSLYPKEVHGILYVTSERVRFESSKFTGRQVEFEFPMEKLKQATVRIAKRKHGGTLGLLVMAWFSKWSFLTLYRKVIKLMYEDEGGDQRPVFHFLDDEKDVRKNLFMELLPSTVKESE